MYTRHISDFMNTHLIIRYFLVYSWDIAVISHTPGVYPTLPIVVNIALHLWLLMNQHHLAPQEAQLAHLLWTLFFMHVYPSGKVACATAGGSNGAIDPKTLRKYVWPMIQAIASLEPHVVCIFCSDTFICLFLLTWCC